MSNKKPENKPSSDAQLMNLILEVIGLLFILAGSISILFIKRNPQFINKMSKKQFFAIFGVIACIGSLLLFLAFQFNNKKQFSFWISLLIGVWLVSIGIVFLTQHIWNKNPEQKRITTQLLKNKAQKFERLIPYLNDKTQIPLGISLLSNEPWHIPMKDSLEHLVICGATGVGKTSSMITMVMHSIRHNYPVIIIDPKGDFTDINLIVQIAKLFNREQDLKIFSLSNPKTSCSYNPLKIGTPEQKKSKLIEGFELNHEYYGRIAAGFLGITFDLLDFLGEKEITIKRLNQIIISQSHRAEIEERLNEYPESPEVTALLESLSAIKQFPAKDLMGLIAQLQAYGLREFGGIMSPEGNSTNEIDLLDCLQTNKIVYFQMNTNAYGDLSMRLGKLILQDIKLISNLFQSGNVQRKYEYGSVFIDEFGSFATSQFANFQKMVRTAGLGLRLFYQGMADLRAVSPEFEKQVLGNSIVKIILRQDIDEDVQKWSGMAGTVDAYIHSYQTEQGLAGEFRTGAGNVHEGKKTKIEFDVFKELGRGQAVIIDKGRKNQDIIQLWDAKDPKYISLLSSMISSGAISSSSNIHTATSQTPLSEDANATKQTTDGFSYLRNKTKQNSNLPLVSSYHGAFQARNSELLRNLKTEKRQ